MIKQFMIPKIEVDKDITWAIFSAKVTVRSSCEANTRDLEIFTYFKEVRSVLSVISAEPNK